MGSLPLLVFSAIIFVPILLIYLIKIFSSKKDNREGQSSVLEVPSRSLENPNLLKYGIIFLIFYLPIIYLFIWSYFLKGKLHEYIILEELYLFIVVVIFGFSLFLFSERSKNV